MSDRWAACVSAANLGYLGALRLFPRVEFAPAGELGWLRGPALDSDLEHALKQVPGLERFDWIESERLRPVGSRIADRRLPGLAWRPLREALPVALPTAALPGEARQKTALSLLRSSAEADATALLTTMEAWHNFSTTTSLVRLDRLRFAVMETGQVLVLGTPLPSAPGTRLAGVQGILVPCGFTWSPAVDAAVLRQLFQLNGEDVVVLAEDHTAQVIRNEQLVPASRSATRASLEELRHA